MPLITQRYGKDKVRLVKVSDLPVNPDAPHLKRQHVAELTVRVLLMGKAFDPSYAVADNALVVPTDTVKNTIYYLAKKTPQTLETIELFAHTISTHFLSKYPHVDGVDVSIQSHNWTRVQTTTFTPTTSDFAGTAVDGRGAGLYTPQGPNITAAHPHSFYRGGDEKRVTSVIAERIGNGKMKVTAKSGLTDLLVLKTTGSSFENFHRCELTTLPDMDDRIFSTTVEAYWDFCGKEEVIPSSAVLEHSGKDVSEFGKVNYDAIFRGCKQVTLDIFANHNSPSVQNTLYRMGEHILSIFPEVNLVHYALPNKHVFGYDLDRFGLQNKGKNMTVFYPVADPSVDSLSNILQTKGLITATIGRSKAKL
ncbi:hypothetical protein HDU67_009068 [Dinochytrium kinnereticum]|nr:hypothetical protein HDU67_009068 [Dinochytrium kinnereticum]